MPEGMEWLDRDHPSYDPNRIGAITQAMVTSALVKVGKVVLVPAVNVCAYDLVIEEEGKFYRVQCKTGRLIKGTVCFRPHRLRAARRETGWVRRVTDYRGKVDFFGVYCPETEGVYLVPIIAVNSNRVCHLRLTAAKNNQRKNIRWANAFKVAPLPASIQPTQKDLPFT